ncbi:MAG: HAD family phosphatase [Chloroflexi bacterium]|nr:HAD family phosphatase [Chloroflexota bacterium]
MTNSLNAYGIIWDMDGVLIDTADAHFHAWQQALFPYQVDFTRQYFDDTFGINNDSLLADIFGEKLDRVTLEVISRQKEELYRDAIKKEFKIYAGVINLLRDCQAAGFKQAIASSAPMENIAAVMQLSTLRPYFDQIISSAQMASKRNPEAYLAATTALKLQPANCLVIEDSLLGIEGAKKAGTKCIAIASTHPVKKLTKADVVVKAVADLTLATILTTLNIKRKQDE